MKVTIFVDMRLLCYFNIFSFLGLTVTVYQPFRIYTTKASGCPLPEDKINVDYSPVSSKESYNIAREKIRSRDPTMRRKLTSSMH